ncbi:MAG: domain containing protein [Chloroflexi bacterium]|nr:domain containing protein [Chloroflexota bacterium]
MTTCPQCGTQNLPGMAYCEHCGAPLAAPAIAPAAPQGGDAGAADAIAQAQTMLNQLNASDGGAATTQPAQDAAHAAPQPAPTASADNGTSADGAAPADNSAGSSPAAGPDTAAESSPAATPDHAPATSSELIITFGDGSRYTVQSDVTNVGRSDIAQNWHPELDVIPFGGGAPDLGVSRHQAVIQRQGGTFTVIDVGSTNGTFVNGQILEYNKPAELHDGDSIAFGAFNGKVSTQ